MFTGTNIFNVRRVGLIIKKTKKQKQLKLKGGGGGRQGRKVEGSLEKKK